MDELRNTLFDVLTDAGWVDFLIGDREEAVDIALDDPRCQGETAADIRKAFQALVEFADQLMDEMS